MKRVIFITLVTLIALVGTTSASLTHSPEILTSIAPLTAVPNPLGIVPGQTLVLSYYATGLHDVTGAEKAPYFYTVVLNDGAYTPSSDISVTFNNDFQPTSQPTYTDPDVITMHLDENAPIGEEYIVTIGVIGGQTVIFGAVSRDVTAIPEFPTVALPVAAILGLAFVFMRRKE